MKYARAKRAKILFSIVKYANLWGFCCRRRRGCLSSLIGSLRNHDDDGNKFAYLIVKNNSFASFARAVFIFDILRHEMTCFAVVWTT